MTLPATSATTMTFTVPTTGAATTTTTASTTTATIPGGVSAAPTTLTSTASATPAPASTAPAPAPAAPTGFSATISAWVSYFVDGIRHCLSYIPLVGKYFEKAPTTPSTVPNPGPLPPSSGAPTNNDAQHLEMVRTAFATSVPAGTVLNDDVVVYALNAFGQIEEAHIKAEAFSIVLSSPASSDSIVKRFHAALPVAVTTEFINQMIVANGNSTILNGVRHRIDLFCHHMIEYYIRSDVARQAATNTAAVLLRNATPVASTTAPAAVV